jgi:hypothetical protein
MSSHGQGRGSYGAAEQRQLAAALARGEPLRCPHCDVALTWQEVRPGEGVPYVRQRVWVLCPECRLSASLDRPTAR